MHRLDAIADAGLRAALALVRGSAASLSADEAAETLGVHRNVARGRLERLVDAGLVTTEYRRRSGRSGPGAGRPAKLYAAAPETEALEFPPHRFPALIAELLDELPHNTRQAALRRAGENFGRTLADAARLSPRADVARGLEAACAAVRSLGFQASVREVGTDRAVIDTPTCPLRPLVVERPEAAEIDRGMWAGLAERAVQDVSAGEVMCETHACLDAGASCAVVMSLRRG